MREQMNYDVLVVGGGPAGLSAVIRVKQVNPQLSVCLIEKGAEVGAHLMSGAAFEPRALDELIPDWKAKGAPLNVPCTTDKFVFLTETSAFRLPTPPQMNNHGNYIISVGQLGRWLAKEAEALGVEIYAGFAGAEVLYGPAGEVIGVATGDMGIGKHGEKTARFTEGVELIARQTIFAEGCRGSLTKKLFERFKLREGVRPQTFGLGVKELWEVKPEKHRAGEATHTIGWPLDAATYGGSWIYHFENNLVSIGYVVGLDYSNPYLSPFREMQKFKTHPFVRSLLEGGKRVAYGARALSEGGFQAIPKLSFPGGVLAGDTAGFLNVPKIKGNHTAMKSGMVAAEAAVAALAASAPEAADYRARLEKTWLWSEIKAVRNIRPGFQKGLWAGLVNAGLETVTCGKLPWTLSHHADHESLKLAADCKAPDYPKPDGVLTFDLLSSVFLSNTNHEEDQPSHLKLRDPSLAVSHNLALYAGPESRYCPAGVYEFVGEGAATRLQINAQNCVHCKTCDIKDPLQNIDWVTPEGGGGPNYGSM